MIDVPTAGGTYVLILKAASTRRVRIGSLGLLDLRPGYYAYVGSAFGPGGLRARISHHQHRSAKPHWHIDYLRRATCLVDIFFREYEHAEHAWATAIAALPESTIVLPRFGSSDCSCATHLYRFEAYDPATGATINGCVVGAADPASGSTVTATAPVAPTSTGPGNT